MPRAQGNVLRCTKGLALLRCLEELDLRTNLIASIHEVVRLSGAGPTPAAAPQSLLQDYRL